MTEVTATTDSLTAGGEQTYDPPTITRLGTLHELTLGAFEGNADGLGGYAGDGGSI